MKQQKALLTPLICIFALLLAACGGGSTPSSGNSSSSNGGVSQSGLSSGNSYIHCPGSTNTTASAAESGSVTLTVSGWTSSPAEDTLVQKNLQNFQTQHPNIKLVWSPITGDYPTKMRANVASNTVPDVFYLQPAMSSEYISAGKLLNLSPYMGKAGVKADDYYSSLISPFTCTSGQVFGLPKDWNSLGVYYNKTMFQQAGLSEPDANWSWNDFQTDATKLTKTVNGKTVYGTVLSADSSRWGAVLLQNGGSVLNKDGTQASFNDKAGVQALDYYNSFFKNKSAALPTTVGASWNGDAFGQQRAAMVLEGGWLTPYMASTFPNVKYGIAPLPKGPDGKQADLSYTNAWAASASTKHPEAAWEFIQYMTGATVQESQLNAGFALPTLKSLANAQYFSTHPDFKVLFDAGTYSYADYYGPQDSAIHTALSNAIQSVVLGKSDSQTALNNAATQVNNQLQGS